jgi:hypothetical protein
MEAPPHPMRLGNDEKDYYRLGAAGVVGGLASPDGPIVAKGSTGGADK